MCFRDILIRVLSVALLASALATAPATRASAFDRPHDPVILSGDTLKALYGRKIPSLRLMAVRDGKLVTIPFQVDKRDPDNEYMTPGAKIPQDIIDATDFDARSEAEKRAERIEDFEDDLSDFEKAVKKGKLAQSELEEKRKAAYWVEKIDELDYNDELAFMGRDAGDALPVSKWPVKDGIELILEDPIKKETAYVYLFNFAANAPALSEADYVRYEAKKDRTESDKAIVDFVDDKPMIIEEIYGKKADGSLMENFVDRFKLRIHMRVKPFFCAGLDFNENNTKSFTVGYIDGPVRVIRRNIFWITIAGIKLPGIPKATIYYIFYEHGMVGPTKINNPIDPSLVLCDGSYFRAGMDLRKVAHGTHLYTEDNPDGLTIDGKLTKHEEGLIRRDQAWLGAYQPDRRFGFVARMTYDEILREKGATMDLYFREDPTEEDEPESEPGTLFVGYEMDMKRFPKGEFNLAFYIYLGPNMESGDERRFLEILDHPIKVKANSLQ
ncbi:MAG: hypothetical protein KDH09_07865 [Chrysiogenetes bacterium]|nr:hypothetical protein [Chrysiogenetes bacterium]